MNQGIISVILNRDGYLTPWGFRLHGGKDIGFPLTIQKVQFGSPAENELRRGDIVLGINDYDASGLTHKDAHDTIKSTGNQLRLLVHRLPGSSQSPYSPPPAKINVHPLATPMPTINKPIATHLPKVVQQPRSWTPPNTYAPSNTVSGFQPVNPPKPWLQSTNKIKKPSPKVPYFMQRLPTSSPPPYISKLPEPPIITDDKPKFVNLQYNSPLALYSKEAVAETLNAHSVIQPKSRPRSPLPPLITKQSSNEESPGSPSLPTPSALSPAKPGTKLTNIVDITLSPTFQMIQERENRSSSPLPVVKTPLSGGKTPPPGCKTPPPLKVSPAPFTRYPSNCYQDPTVNAFGAPKDTIHQSGSFKTLMATLSFYDGEDL